jgi:arylsulfatase A-like enzyme
LAAESFVFENAYTPYPTSNYAYNGMFMSLAPRITKVYTDKYQPAIKHDPLHALPALAAKHGWKTGAVASFNKVDLANPRLFKYLQDGFETFNPDPWESMASGAQIAASASELTTKMSASGRLPYFFWAHFLDPHAPYQDNPGFHFGDTTRDWYVSDIAYSDHHVGAFIEHLKRQNLWDDTIVVAFSDHGEEFGERGGRDHNGSVYEEQIKVPLLIKLPGVSSQKKRIRSTVSLLDLQPTLVRLLKLDDPLPRLGRSLLPLIFGPENPEGGAAYAEWFTMAGNFRGTERRALILGRRKIIHRVNERSYELYDLAADPAERTSLIGEARDEDVLKALLAKWDERIDGYFGGGAASRKSAAEPFRAILQKVRTKNDEARKLAATDAAAAREASSAARAAVVEYRNAILTGYGDVYPHVALSLTPEELDGLFTDLAALYPELGDGPAAEALITLARRRDRRFEPIYRREIEPLFKGDVAKLRGGAMEALIALTTFEDQSVKLPLQVAYTDPALPFKGAIAVGLARLGDFTGADWFVLNLSALKFGSVYRDTILAAPKAFALMGENAPLPPSRMIRDRLTEEDYRHNEIELAYVEALRHLRDEDATTLLLRLARHTVSDVRDAAQAALKDRFADPAEFARRLEAADEELTADNMLLNMTPEMATPTYRRAIEQGGVFNAGARFRMARAFHLGKNVDLARATLEEIAAKAPLEVDRALARRRIGQLKYSVLQSPEKFGAEVVSVSPPEIIRSTQFFSVRARLKNTGQEPWWGGYAKGAVDIGVRFVQPDGAIYETVDEKNITNRITENGVEPRSTSTSSATDRAGSSPASWRSSSRTTA